MDRGQLLRALPRHTPTPTPTPTPDIFNNHFLGFLFSFFNQVCSLELLSS